MKSLLRSFWFAVGLTIYVGFAALEARSQNFVTGSLLVGAIVVLWLTWRYTRLDENVLAPSSVTLSETQRAVVTGAALFTLARTGPLGHSGFDAAANLGVGIVLVSSCIALARIGGRGGLLSAPRATQSLDAAALSALLWAIATTLPALRTVLPQSILALDPLAIDYATVTASMASLLLLVANTARLNHFRRLEYDVADRAASAFIATTVALLATIPALLLDIMPPDRAVPAVVVATGLYVVWAAGAPDARRVSASLRGTLAVLAFLAPVVLLLAIFAKRSPAYAPMLIVASAALGVLLGIIASRLSRPLAPEQSRWLDAIEHAAQAALIPDPDDALRATLAALSPTAAGPSSRVELWRLDPPSVQYVDIAEQLHEESLSVPGLVLTLAQIEPERTLRADVLRTVQVRNTSAREALAFFDTRRTYAATLLTSDGTPTGLLALPQSHRKAPLSLEECSALRRLSDRLESVLAITSAQARSRERELATRAKVTELEQETARLHTALLSTGARQRHFVERYAQRLEPQVYSATSRAAYLEVERLAKQCREVTFVLPPGVDALSWASHFHLSSPRHLGPFVVFDAASGTFEHEVWDDPVRGPLALAETGTWVLMNPQSLSPAQQEALSSVLVRWKATQVIESSTPMAYVLALHAGRDASPEEELPIGSPLQAFFPIESRVHIAPLAQRPEDLRAAVQERLARLGTVYCGRALGIEPNALVDLLEYDFPLNDLELESTLTALVLVAEGDRVRTAELERIGFYARVAVRATAAGETPAPQVRQRPSSRSARPKAR